MPSIRPGESDSSCPSTPPRTLRTRRISGSVNQARSSGRIARVVPTRPRIEIGPWTGMVRQIRDRPSIAHARTNGIIDLALSDPDLFAPHAHVIVDTVAFDVHRHQRLPSFGGGNVTKTRTHWLDQDDIETTLHRLLHPNSVLPRASLPPPLRGPSRASHAIGCPSVVDATGNIPASTCPGPRRAASNRDVPDGDVLSKLLHLSGEHVSELLILHGFKIPLVLHAPTAERTPRASSSRLSRAVESPSFDTGIPVLRTGDGLAGSFASSNVSVPPRAKPALLGASESQFERTHKPAQYTVFGNGLPEPKLAFRVLPGDDRGDDSCSRQQLGGSSQRPKNPLPSLALRIRHSDKIVA